MDTGCNPKKSWGERNVFCPHYGDCLNHVILKGWSSWDCSQCEYRYNLADRPEMPWCINHSVAYYELPKMG